MKKFGMYSLSIMSVTLILCLALIPQLRIATSIGTGLGLTNVQQQVDRLHVLGKQGVLSAEDLIWMRDLYFILATGAKASFILPASSKLMFHYLDSSGESLTLAPEVFRESDRVISVRQKLNRSLCNGVDKVSSSEFDMGGKTPLDSAFALYFGTLSAEKVGGKVRYKVKMPWKWPTYRRIKQRYGSYEKEIFPIPNLLSVLTNTFQLGSAQPLYLPNALGGELERVGLAKSFNVTSEWSESINCNTA